MVTQLGRRKIHFTDHALDRWWNRCEANNMNGRQAALGFLKEKLAESKWERSCPPWSRLKLWNKARAEGYIRIDENSAFVVNRNPNKELVAVTYIENSEVNPRSFQHGA